jgi:hypothetical protein
MKSEIINRRKQLKTGFPTETYEGETIEKKCARMIENNEPITSCILNFEFSPLL